MNVECVWGKTASTDMKFDAFKLDGQGQGQGQGQEQAKNGSSKEAEQVRGETPS